MSKVVHDRRLDNYGLEGEPLGNWIADAMMHDMTKGAGAERTELGKKASIERIARAFGSLVSMLADKGVLSDGEAFSLAGVPEWEINLYNIVIGKPYR